MPDRIRAIRNGQVIGSMPHRERAHVITYEVTKEGHLVTPELREKCKHEWLMMGMFGPPGAMGYAFRIDLWEIDSSGDPVTAVPLENTGSGHCWRFEFFINADDCPIEKIPGWVGVPPKRIIELPSY
jgi:hypothetical protein